MKLYFVRLTYCRRLGKIELLNHIRVCDYLHHLESGLLVQIILTLNPNFEKVNFTNQILNSSRNLPWFLDL